jgi:hypothetical protein
MEWLALPVSDMEWLALPVTLMSFDGALILEFYATPLANSV